MSFCWLMRGAPPSPLCSENFRRSWCLVVWCLFSRSLLSR
uniref:Uncharacterized protein n=1 Tax=Podoviridae sp. ctz6O13 TaxID=2827757 RepID=A0A8S5TL16_9CAUD|nr:MAG TPA: hypothetical protein [Podoviridae sp. ctz6O13]